MGIGEPRGRAAVDRGGEEHSVVRERLAHGGSWAGAADRVPAEKPSSSSHQEGECQRCIARRDISIGPFRPRELAALPPLGFILQSIPVFFEYSYPGSDLSQKKCVAS